MPSITQKRRQYYQELTALLKKNRITQVEFAELTGIELGRIKNLMRGSVDWKLPEMYTILDLFHKTDRDLPVLFPRNKIVTDLPDPKHDWRYQI